MASTRVRLTSMGSAAPQPACRVQNSLANFQRPPTFIIDVYRVRPQPFGASLISIPAQRRHSAGLVMATY